MPQKQLKHPSQEATKTDPSVLNLDDLRTLLNRKQPLEYDNWGWPKPPTAPNFRPETSIVGTQLAQEMEKLYKLAPELRGRVKEITPGLTKLAIKDTVKNNSLRPLEFGTLTGGGLMGMTGPDKRISIGTGHGDKDDFDTLVHELYHVVGQDGLESNGFGFGPRSEMNSDAVGRVAGKLYKDISMKYPSRKK